MSSTQPTTPQRPSHEQWEHVRFFILKLWYEDKETLPSIILRLQNDRNLHASPRTLKKKLQEWGLIKKTNPQDAEDLRTAQARLDALGQTGLLLLRGRLEQIKRVHDYRRRRRRAHDHHPTSLESTTNSTLSQVIALSCHPRLRPEPALTLLGKFESLLREMQLLLHAAKEASMCIPGRTTLDWKTSSTESENLERSLQYSTWEGARAYEEGDVFWARLCWQSALLTLEDLFWQPDLNVWICFIRCCVRLARFQAKEVAQLFLSKLRGLRDLLPLSAPHRALVHALSDLTVSDLVDGCLFILELNLRNVELLWPLEKDSHIEYQLHLEEERLYQGFDMTRLIPHLFDSRSFIQRNIGQDSWMQRSQISACMLLSEYGKAETIASSTISQLENQKQSHVDKQQGNVLSTLLASWYLLLGNIQYYKSDHLHSCVSYLKCLEFHRDTQETQTGHALQPTQVRRILKLLSWLSTTPTLRNEEAAFTLGVYKKNLEMELDAHLQGRVDAPFPQQPNHNYTPPTKFPTKLDLSKKRMPNKYSDMRSIPERPRVVQRPVFSSVDRDKAQISDTPDVVGREKNSSKLHGQRSTTAHRSPARTKPPPATGRGKGGRESEKGKGGGKGQAARKGKGGVSVQKHGEPIHGSVSTHGGREFPAIIRPTVPWG